MIRELVRLRDRNQITLPAEIAEHLSVEPGALLELILDPNHDYLELRPAEVVRAGTPQAEREERWAKEDIKAGRFKTFANTEALAADLRKSRDAEQFQEQQEKIEILQQQVRELALDIRKMGLGTNVQLATSPVAEASSK